MESLLWELHFHDGMQQRIKERQISFPNGQQCHKNLFVECTNEWRGVALWKSLLCLSTQYGTRNGQ